MSDEYRPACDACGAAADVFLCRDCADESDPVDYLAALRADNAELRERCGGLEKAAEATVATLQGIDIDDWEHHEDCLQHGHEDAGCDEADCPDPWNTPCEEFPGLCGCGVWELRTTKANLAALLAARRAKPAAGSEGTT